MLKDEGYIFNLLLTSVLKRVIRTGPCWMRAPGVDHGPPLVAVPDDASMAAMPGWPQALQKLKKCTSAGLAEPRERTAPD